VFRLNDDPILTEHEGSFNCIALMDVASCFILSNALVPLASSDVGELDARRLLKQAWEHKQAYPETLLVPPRPFLTTLATELKRHGSTVVPVKSGQIRIFVGEAQQGFREFVSRGRN